MRSGKWSATGLRFGVVGLLIAPLLSLLMTSALRRPDWRNAESNARGADLVHMKHIAAALAQYEKDNNGNVPADLAVLWKNESGLAAADFICCATNDIVAPNPNHLYDGAHLSYVYTGRSMRNPNDVIIYENVANHNGAGSTILFGDGLAIWYWQAAAQGVIARGWQ